MTDTDKGNTPTPEKVTEFLTQSNNIEGVFEEEQLEDAQKAWDYLMWQKTVSISDILEIHTLLMDRRGAWEESTISMVGRSLIGKFRNCGVWIGGRPGMRHDLIPDAVEQWCEKYGDPQKEFDPKQAHIEYEGIHPFIDGNGRTGRLLYNWHRVKKGLPLHIIHVGKEQSEYYQWFKE